VIYIDDDAMSYLPPTLFIYHFIIIIIHTICYYCIQLSIHKNIESVNSVSRQLYYFDPYNYTARMMDAYVMLTSGKSKAEIFNTHFNSAEGMYLFMHVCIYVCMYVCMHICMYICCMYVCMYVCMIV